jgi:hypothetical protein
MQDKRSQLLILFVAVLIAAQGILMSVVFYKVHTLENSVANLKNKSQPASEDAIIALNAASLSQPAISVSENKVYFPEVSLSIPLSKQATTLLYSGRTVGGEPAKATTTYDVTTRPFASLSNGGFQTELSCIPVRFSFEAIANPYNDHEKPAKPVKLADGRTLQVYTYSNQKCDAQWKAANVDPGTIAELFEKASSY